jgi:tetratricopeptide (TPR) repeat protein
VEASLFLLVLLALLAIASFAASRRIDLTGVVLVAAFGVLTWQAWRNLSLLALVAVAVMASNLGETRWAGGVPPWLKRMMALAGALFGVAVVGMALDAAPFSAMTPLPRLGFGVDANQEPVRAARFLQSHRLTSRLFNDYADGGYLVWRLGDRPLFIDSLNAYDADIFAQYQQIVAFGPPAEELIRRWGINAFVLHQQASGAASQAPLLDHLAHSPKWRLVFWDGVSLIYVRDLPANRAVIRRDGYAFVDPANLQSPVYRRHPAEVSAEVRRAVAASPDSPNLRVLAGFIYLAAGKTQEAASEFAQALRISPDFAEAYTGLGVLFLQAGDLARSEAMFRQAASFGPHDAAPHRGLAAVAEARGDLGRALAERKAAARLAPGSVQDRVRLALAYEAAHNTRRAANTWREVLALGPDAGTERLARNHLAALAAR